ncbi:MAG TPA: YbhB/YbcL family Raf kinase inhibitor-like protein [Solirubrobacteraceae bacterium]|nr:YbhB/YbcL family Raf kinase inhibitor-like protein [Solirubrobacteraceae bacterium]
MRVAPAILAVLVTVSVAGCGGGSSKSSTTPPPGSGASIAVSSDFKPGAAISRVHTCDGRDVSPPLHATGLPASTKELVVVMRDPDAPGGNFIHWVIANLEPASGSISLPAGATPPGAVLGRNSFGSLGYRGPCPPSGPAHHYVITVYALGQPSRLRKGFSADDVSGLPVLGQGTLTGRYAKQ